jgi:hypothetical protein
MAERSEFGEYQAEVRRKALGFGRLVQCLALAKGDLLQARVLANSSPDRRVRDAIAAIASVQGAGIGDLIEKGIVSPGSSADVSWAGPLVQLMPLASEFVSYLHRYTCFGRLLQFVRRVPFNVKFSRATAGTQSAAWIGQGAPLAVSAMAFDLLSLSFAKMGGLAVISQELVKFGSPDAASVIVNDMSEALAALEDASFFDPSNAGSSSIRPASVTHGVTPLISSGSSAQQIAADAKTALAALDALNFPPSGRVWVADTLAATHIQTLVSSTGVRSFPEFRDNGEFFGLPVLVTGGGIDSNSPPHGTLILLHAPSIAVASLDVADVSITQSASVQMDSDPASGAQQLVSLWQSNLVAAKATLYANWLVRRTGATQVITGIAV